MTSIKKETFRDLMSLNLFAWVDSPSSAAEPGQSKQPADMAVGTNMFTRETSQESSREQVYW